MLKAAKLRNSVRDATNFGWRAPLLVDSLTLNWKKMSDLVTDNIMKENWILVNKLAEEGVEIIEGRPSFIDAHTIRILQHESKECVVSANFICTGKGLLKSYKVLLRQKKGNNKIVFFCQHHPLTIKFHEVFMVVQSSE